MPRGHRLDAPGALRRVMVRGLEQRVLFHLLVRTPSPRPWQAVAEGVVSRPCEANGRRFQPLGTGKSAGSSVTVPAPP